MIAMSTICLKASGLPLQQLQGSPAKQIAHEFKLQKYGKGTHNTFKRMLTRATTAGHGIESWFARYLRTLPEEDEVARYPTHEE